MAEGEYLARALRALALALLLHTSPVPPITGVHRGNENRCAACEGWASHFPPASDLRSNRLGSGKI